MRDQPSRRLAVLWSGLACLWSLSLTGACLIPPFYGVLYPRDSDYLVGTNVTLRCILDVTLMEDKEKNRTDYFNSSNIIIASEKGPLPVVVETAMEAQHMIVSGQLNDSMFYWCKLHLPDRKVFVCPTLINFGHPPTDVLDFKCRSIGYRELTCWWTSAPNKIKTNYTLEILLFYPRKDMAIMCPKQLNETSCQYTLSSLPPYNRYMNPLHMRLTGKNSLGSHNQTFQFNHFALVVPGPSREMVASAMGTESVTLSWRLPEGMEWGSFKTGVCYRLFYRASYPQTFQVKEQDFQIVDVGSNKTSFVLWGLRPNTWYSLKLQGRSCLASPLEDDLWGPNVTLGVRTRPDIPWSPPEASETLFDVVTFNNRRNITLYWKRIPKTEENADDFQYSVKYTQTYLDRGRRDLNPRQEVTTVQPHYTFVNLETSSAYEFQIFAVNKLGTSVNFTSVTVERTDKMPARPMNVRPVSRGGGLYTISWTGDDSLAGGYTLIWCKRARPTEYRCDQQIMWRSLPSNTTSENLQLQDEYYDFAVAATSPSEIKVGSGLEWAPCTVDINKVNLVKVQGVNLISESPRTLNVSWKLGCEALKAVIQEYHIYACPIVSPTCSDKNCNFRDSTELMIKNSQAERAQLTNLLPFTEYIVSVAVLTKDGYSEKSDARCHATVPEAPSDPPHEVNIHNVTNTTIKVSWRAPNRTNGIISHYWVYYNDRRIRVPVHQKQEVANVTLVGLRCFTNYTVRVSACVQAFCSNESDAENVLTEIGAPGPMDPPRTEYVNSSHIKVTWKAPEQANGPLDLYLLHLYLQKGDTTQLNKLNVTGTSVLIPQDCPTDGQSREDNPHLFRIQAANFLNGPDVLYGPLSEASKNKLCSMDGELMNYSLIIGIFVGCTLTLGAIILVLYLVIRWMKTRVDLIKDIKVDLPSGLETPYSNALNSYENFKSGLSSRGSDPNLSPKMGYGRMDSVPGHNFNKDDERFKNRHGSGASHLSAASTEQLLSKQCPVPPNITPSAISAKGERNPSGDSSSGHDSLSSSLTNRTNLSSDSSTTTEDPLRKEIQGPGSTDSGLEEENKPPKVPDYLPVASYSKLGMTGPGYKHLKGRHLSLYTHNLANSEPSITDIANSPYMPPDSHPIQFTAEPPSPDVPYSKFGLSRSETDLMIQDDLESPDSPQPHETLPYSRFGLCRSSQQSPYVTVGMALLSCPQKDPRNLLLDKHVMKKKELPESVQDGAYSKLGLAPTLEEVQPPKSNGYVTLQDIKVSEENRSLPDLTISSGEESPSTDASVVVGGDQSSKSGYLPHQLISTLKTPPEANGPDLPDVVNCSSVLPLSTMLQMPEVKVQGNNGYITLNQVLTPSTEV